MQKINNKQSMIKLSSVKKGFYQNSEKYLNVINGIDLEVKDGEFLAILGPSGCGKSTLLDILARVESVDSGIVEYSNKLRMDSIGCIGVVWQEDSLIPWKTVRKNIEFPLLLAGMNKNERRYRINKWIHAMNLDDFGNYYPSQLSQGMRKRVALAASLVSEPQLLLMDEPFSALDAYTKHQIEKEVVKLWESINTTIILVTHDVQEAVALADRILVLTERPAVIKEIRDNLLPRPRNLDILYGQPEFHETVRKLWLHLTERPDDKMAY